ncbi:hypothetical protein BACSP_01885 [Bacillus sp. T2.9-1]|nr:hypothetical protein BACSP_01885 [Bacillus sp. T2.9-1]
MTETFSTLYKESQKDKKFNRLYELIISEENILLAYRKIKKNKGSGTPGTDTYTIEEYKNIGKDDFIRTIRKSLNNYKPKPVKRVLIPKENGDTRPLGIPTMLDRLIQQMIKQILEPIAEAKFFKHSYGFRPLRSAHHAISRCNFLVKTAKLQYAVDMDIKGFFDNVNHRVLIKQLWNMGIQDRRVLVIIGKILKAPIRNVGIPTKGTPQGGVLSPLLSNIVLHDLDMWIASQWEDHPSHFDYSTNSHRNHALKKTKLKQGYLVRYADDFKILTTDVKTAYKWYHAVRLYLKDRLNLDISPEKSKVINLRKQGTEFLGYRIRAVKHKSGFVTRSDVRDKSIKRIKARGREIILEIRNSPTAGNIQKWNSFVLGVHGYFKHSSLVSIVFARIAYDLSRLQYNRFRPIGKFVSTANAPPSYKKFYGKNNAKTWKISGRFLYPITDIKFSPAMNFNQNLTVFTERGRQLIHSKLQADIGYQITILAKHQFVGYSLEFMDNRISRYSMVQGKCEITGEFLEADLVHCHHFIPSDIGGTDEYKNLRIIHVDVHKLVHATDSNTIQRLKNGLNLNTNQLNKLNSYRKVCNLEMI